MFGVKPARAEASARKNAYFSRALREPSLAQPQNRSDNFIRMYTINARRFPLISLIFVVILVALRL
jgi:hypothetical protein